MSLIIQRIYHLSTLQNVFHLGYEESEDDADDQNPLQTKHFVTIIPVGSSGLDINHQPLPSKSVDLFELSSFHNFAFEAREINNTVRMSHQAGSDDNLTSSESEEEITFTEVRILLR